MWCCILSLIRNAFVWVKIPLHERFYFFEVDKKQKRLLKVCLQFMVCRYVSVTMCLCLAWCPFFRIYCFLVICFIHVKIKGYILEYSWVERLPYSNSLFSNELLLNSNKNLDCKTLPFLKHSFYFLACAI